MKKLSDHDREEVTDRLRGLERTVLAAFDITGLTLGDHIDQETLGIGRAMIVEGFLNSYAAVRNARKEPR